MAIAEADSLTPTEVLRAAWEELGDGLVMTTAFGLEGSVILHMIAREGLPIRVLTLDTGLFFQKTKETWARLSEQLGLHIEGVLPELTLEEQAERHGPELWTRQPDLCCNIRKVQPLHRVLGEAKGWITGIRRDQTPERANAPRVGHEPRFDVIKVNPLVDWTAEQVRAYLIQHDIPYNPMFDDGYPSIGCEPCTQRVAAGGDERDGRWAGSEKRECGLHWDTGADGTIELRRKAP